MAQTLVEIIIHVVFSTKNRENFIAPEIEKELFVYIGGIHVQLFILQSKKIALSDLIREVKRASSLWIKQKDVAFGNFQWQGGFGAFSVSKLKIEIVKKYIANQKEHHKTENFDDEYRKFLRRYEMDFDEKYFLD